MRGDERAAAVGVEGSEKQSLGVVQRKKEQRRLGGCMGVRWLMGAWG